jgi:hypothetical protein
MESVVVVARSGDEIIYWEDVEVQFVFHDCNPTSRRAIRLVEGRVLARDPTPRGAENSEPCDTYANEETRNLVPQQMHSFISCNAAFSLIILVKSVDRLERTAHFCGLVHQFAALTVRFYVCQSE